MEIEPAQERAGFITLRVANPFLTVAPIGVCPGVAVVVRRLRLLRRRGSCRAAGPYVERNYQNGGNGQDNEPNRTLGAHANRFFLSRSARPRGPQGPRQLGTLRGCRQRRVDRLHGHLLHGWETVGVTAVPVARLAVARAFARCFDRCPTFKHQGCVGVTEIVRTDRRHPGMQRAQGPVEEPPAAGRAELALASVVPLSSAA